MACAATGTVQVDLTGSRNGRRGGSEVGGGNGEHAAAIASSLLAGHVVLNVMVGAATAALNRDSHSLISGKVEVEMGN
jgi:hypothetical protein